MTNCCNINNNNNNMYNAFLSETTFTLCLWVKRYANHFLLSHGVLSKHCFSWTNVYFILFYFFRLTLLMYSVCKIHLQKRQDFRQFDDVGVVNWQLHEGFQTRNRHQKGRRRSLTLSTLTYKGYDSHVTQSEAFLLRSYDAFTDSDWSQTNAPHIIC